MIAGNFMVTFNEPVAVGTGNVTLKNLTDGSSSDVTIAITDGSQVSVAGAALIINPTADLTAGKDYAIRIDAGAVTDVSGNPFAGIADDTTWNFTTASANIWTPVYLAGKALWLDASDGTTITLNGSTVSQWNDKSGNGRNAIQTTAARQPAYTSGWRNGLPGVSFTAANQNWMSSSLSASSASETIVAVLSQGGSDTRSVIGANADGGREIRFATDTTLNFLRQAQAGLATSGTMPSGPGFVMGFTYNSSTTTFYSNGAVSGTPASVNPNLVAGRTSTIGSFGTSWDFLTGTIGEFVVCSSVLSTADRQKLEGYLAWKWGLQTNLPAGHPYQSAPPIAAVSTPYEDWADGGLFLDDDNGDGVANGLAFLLGADGKDANSLGRLPGPSNDNGKLVMTFDCLAAAARGTAVLKLQYSKDLGVADLWSSHEVAVPGTEGSSDVGYVHFEATANGSLIHVVASVAASEASIDGKLFGRLQASE
jgi:hypothetical protein